MPHLTGCVVALCCIIPVLRWLSAVLPQEISLFETNIRVVGGLLSAYDFSGDKVIHLTMLRPFIKYCGFLSAYTYVWGLFNKKREKNCANELSGHEVRLDMR